MPEGLKNIEKELNLARKEIIKDFHGGDAVTLWRMYRATGNEDYLNLLIEYNEYDIMNLKVVAENCVKRMKENLFNSNFSPNALPGHSSIKPYP